MTIIDLSRPTGQHKVRGFQPPWRTVFEYLCPQGHKVNIYANSFRGRTPVPGVGAITCPQCEFHAKYPQ